MQPVAQHQYHWGIPAPNVEVKNVWNYNSIPPHVFMVWFLVKDGDNFTGAALEKVYSLKPSTIFKY
jgi:hypothetical protein